MPADSAEAGSPEEAEGATAVRRGEATAEVGLAATTVAAATSVVAGSAGQSPGCNSSKSRASPDRWPSPTSHAVCPGTPSRMSRSRAPSRQARVWQTGSNRAARVRAAGAAQVPRAEQRGWERTERATMAWVPQ
eukprot:6002678-Prymnesium_polylepis.1